MHTVVVVNPLTGEEEIFTRRNTRGKPGNRHVQLTVSLKADHIYAAEQLRCGGLSEAVRGVLELVSLPDEWARIAEVRGEGNRLKGLKKLLACAFNHEEGKGFTE